MRKTKIICTIGPSTNSYEMIEDLLVRGMDVARLNFSHGSQDLHLETIHKLRSCAKKLGVPLAILQDLQGFKMRIGRLQGGRTELTAGSNIAITSENIVGNSGIITTDYRELSSEVIEGDPILLADGTLELRVISSDDTRVRCEVIRGGTLTERQGLNLPNMRQEPTGLTQKDKSDLSFGIKNDVDYIASSFVRRADDIKAVKQFVWSQESEIPIIAKLETAQALEHLDSILDEAEGVMVARGDLGVEISIEKVPTWQKHIILEANKRHVLVITATQMMESMIRNPQPTRAEVSDIANAVFDGTDAVMLSGETAIGAHALETVSIMGKIVQEAEMASLSSIGPQDVHISEDFSHSISYAARRIVGLNPTVCAVVAFTQSGFTARLISKARPNVPILAPTPDLKTYRQLAMVWGVSPLLAPQIDDIEPMVTTMDATIQKLKIGKQGDSIVILGGLPWRRQKGITNFLRLHELGSPIQSKFKL